MGRSQERQSARVICATRRHHAARSRRGLGMGTLIHLLFYIDIFKNSYYSSHYFVKLAAFTVKRVVII